MMLWTEVSTMRGQIKHAPEQVDLQEVRQLLGRVEDALDVLGQLTSGVDLHIVDAEEPGGWKVTIHTVVDDRRPLLDWMANG